MNREIENNTRKIFFDVFWTQLLFNIILTCWCTIIISYVVLFYLWSYGQIIQFINSLKCLGRFFIYFWFHFEDWKGEKYTFIYLTLVAIMCTLFMCRDTITHVLVVCIDLLFKYTEVIFHCLWYYINKVVNVTFIWFTWFFISYR